MILVEFDPDALVGAERVWWDGWWARAQAAIVAAREDAAAGRGHTFRQAIWKDLKDWLLRHVFSGKCAYCESLVSAGFYGDAEHYRPKGKVTNQRVVVLINGVAHPGYYWLAYHWKNLVPACERCNSEAKGTEFEVAGTYAIDDQLDPDELDALESPQLLHPYGPQDPAQCLTFGEFGRVAACDNNPRGATTIRTCGLDRDDLATARHSEQDAGWTKFLDLMHRQKTKDFKSWVRSRPYSAAVIQYVSRKYKESCPTL